jgi:hypothetical protein
MRHPLRLAIVLTGSAAVLLVVSLGAVYRASQQVPEFYQEAIRGDAQRQAAASKEMLRTATALASDVQKEGEWQAEFTEEQVNGWLAVDLAENHGKALPPEVHDPRVAIRPDGVKIGWRWNSDGLSTVFSLDAQFGLAEPNVVALTIRGAKAGKVPLPLNRILDTVTAAAQEMNLHLQWKTTRGHPVALFTVPEPDSEEQKTIVVETLELRHGSIFLSGKTLPGEEWSATRDWTAFLEQMGEHAEPPQEIKTARRPNFANQDEASRNVQ